jgi:hypothetical protein
LGRQLAMYMNRKMRLLLMAFGWVGNFRNVVLMR